MGNFEPSTPDLLLCPCPLPQYANPAFKSTMGYQSGDLLGKEVPAQEKEGTLLGKVRL